MKDLDSELKKEVVPLCEKGVDQSERERYEASNRSFHKVYDILPEPKEEWKAYGWLHASMADNYFELKEYSQALLLFQEAQRGDAQYMDNAYVIMRIGQCHYELSEKGEALIFLKKAYALGGDEVFEDEYVKYKKLAQDT